MTIWARIGIGLGVAALVAAAPAAFFGLIWWVGQCACWWLPWLAECAK